MKKNIFRPDPAQDRTRDPPHKNPTLPRCYKSRLVLQGSTSVYIHIYTLWHSSPPHWNSSSNFWEYENHLKWDSRFNAHVGYLRWAPNVTGEEKYLQTRPGWGSNPRPSAQKSITLPRRYKSRLVPRGSTSVYIHIYIYIYIYPVTYVISLWKFRLFMSDRSMYYYCSDSGTMGIYPGKSLCSGPVSILSESEWCPNTGSTCLHHFMFQYFFLLPIFMQIIRLTK